MNIDDTTYELIEKYLGGLMSEEQRLEFEGKMASSPELADQVEIFRMMPEYLDEHSFPDNAYESNHPKAKAYLDEYLKKETRALKDHLEDRSSQLDRTGPVPQKLHTWQVLRVAAVFVIMLGAAFFLFRPSESQRLYSKYSEHKDLMLNVRGEAGQESAMSQQVEALFNSERYTEALPFMEILAGDLESPNYDLKLAMGIARLESGDHEGAVGEFAAIYNSDALVRNDALYFQALAYLKNGDKQKAKTTLEQVRAEFPEYRKDAVDKMIRKL